LFVLGEITLLADHRFQISCEFREAVVLLPKDAARVGERGKHFSELPLTVASLHVGLSQCLEVELQIFSLPPGHIVLQHGKRKRIKAAGSSVRDP
jgi:hypothetical protein